jgi:hypothetical protein
MKLVKNYIEHLCEEVEGAKDYAEKYIECRAKGESTRASKYREMASDELSHAASVRDMAYQDIKRISEMMVIPMDIEDEWDKAAKHCEEQIALVKQMLA